MEKIAAQQSGRSADIADRPPRLLRVVSRSESSNPALPQPGDVIFGNRLSWMQRVMNVSGDYLTHSGIVIDDGGKLAVVELGARGPFTRSLNDFTSAYRFYAYGRLNVHHGCRAWLTTGAVGATKSPTATYSYGTCTMLEFFMLLRRYAPASAEDRAVNSGLAAAARLSRWTTGVTCSGFVYDLLQSMCPTCRPALTWPTRERVAPWKAAPSCTDVRPSWRAATEQPHEVVRALVMPYDLWTSLDFDFKVVVAPDVTTVITDEYDAASSADFPIAS